MSLQTQLNSFVLRVAEEFNTVKGRTGTLTALTTTDKSSLVAEAHAPLAGGKSPLKRFELGGGVSHGVLIGVSVSRASGS